MLRTFYTKPSIRVITYASVTVGLLGVVCFDGSEHTTNLFWLKGSNQEAVSSIDSPGPLIKDEDTGNEMIKGHIESLRVKK